LEYLSQARGVYFSGGGGARGDIATPVPFPFLIADGFYV
jgi:hypothetical protein